MKQLRIIIQTSDYGTAANIGGPVITEFKTFDVPAPDELVEFMEKNRVKWRYAHFHGAELLDKEST